VVVTPGGRTFPKAITGSRRVASAFCFRPEIPDTSFCFLLLSLLSRLSAYPPSTYPSPITWAFGAAVSQDRGNSNV
jgi:hypothetical protein